ncbi:lysoplasmalogenase TMEM86B-like [Palaemon carinicauda]|uniref:lysoplasmalogenase TMEM86B-like n=1 Tax=Palaemon carinicauda TaxID=392227 RepID=UPI0035B6448F
MSPPWFHLVPFLATVTASFIWFVPKSKPSIFSMVCKCLPVIHLVIYLFYMDGWSHYENKLVLVALILSALGDAFLVCPKPFGGLTGVIAFGLAQIVFSCAFGFRSVSWYIGLILYIIVFIVFGVIVVLESIPPHYFRAVPVFILYGILIATMLWRAIDRFHLEEELLLERRICTLLGAIIFVVSDLSIIFLQGAEYVPQPYSKFVTISTYYTAQLLITLGASQRFWELEDPFKK